MIDLVVHDRVRLPSPNEREKKEGLFIKLLISSKDRLKHSQKKKKMETF